MDAVKVVESGSARADVSADVKAPVHLKDTEKEHVMGGAKVDEK